MAVMTWNRYVTDYLKNDSYCLSDKHFVASWLF